MIALASILALVGCGESNQYSPSIKPLYSVSISQLAARLGLTVQTAGSPYYELKNANNRVLLPNWSLDVVVSADLGSGDRAVVSSRRARPSVARPPACSINMATGWQCCYATARNG